MALTLIELAFVVLTLKMTIFWRSSLSNKLKTFTPVPGFILSAESTILGLPTSKPSVFNSATAAYTVAFTWN